jgi:hypothetical protein
VGLFLLLRTPLLIGLLLGGAILSTGSPLLADTVRGYVLHPNTGEQVAGVEVAFYLQQEGQVDELLRKTTDGQGRFEFSGPFLQDGLSFALAAFYEGVPHFTSTLEVGAQQEVIVEVYDPTSDDRQLRIPTHSLFLNLTGDNLDVAHLVQVENPEDKTYIGSGEEGLRQVTRFILPSGVAGLQSHSGRLIQAGGTLFHDTQPLLPGTTQITFTFSLDAQQLDRGYVHQASYPTERLDIFLQPSDFQPGAPLRDLGVVDLHGSQYRRLQLNGLDRDQRITIPLPLVHSRRWMLKWAALGAIALAGLAATWGLRRRRVVAPAAIPTPQNSGQRREELLERIARLDDAHAGREDDPEYRTERARLVEQALTAFRTLEGRNGDE